MNDNILEQIGNTPLRRFENLEKETNLKSQIYGKLEMFNPTGSIKARPVKYIIIDMINKGIINEKSTIIEATSGNTGIAMAAICKALNIKSIVVMPENMSEERKEIIKNNGASLILTKKELGMQGSIDEANKLIKKNSNSVLLGQFTNYQNVLAHYETTAREIYEDLEDVDYIITGVGSGGTITGIGKFFKENSSKCKIVAVEPNDSPLLSKGISGPHLIQGIGANFIPKILDRSIIDEIKTVSYEDAKRCAKLVLENENILLGISASAAMSVAIDLAKKELDKKIVVILPDGGDKYLTTDFYK